MCSSVQTVAGFHSTLADIHARAATRSWFVKVWISCAEGLDAGADILLLDNFTPELLHEAVALNAGRAKLEASGGVTLDNIRRIAETGVDYVSTGALTKDVKAIGLSALHVVARGAFSPGIIAPEAAKDIEEIYSLFSVFVFSVASGVHILSAESCFYNMSVAPRSGMRGVRPGFCLRARLMCIYPVCPASPAHGACCLGANTPWKSASGSPVAWAQGRPIMR